MCYYDKNCDLVVGFLVFLLPILLQMMMMINKVMNLMNLIVVDNCLDEMDVIQDTHNLLS